MLDVDPAPPKKRHSNPAPIFWSVYCGEMAGWIKMPLGTEVHLGPGNIVLDGGPAPPSKSTAAPLFSSDVCCEQTIAHVSY